MKKLWIVKMVFFGAAAMILMTAVVMWLWNWLVPVLFLGPIISFWQALGIMILSRILFRGFHGMKGRMMYGRGWNNWRNWKEHMDKMSPEEREKMRELWKKRCGGFNCDDEPEPK